MTDENAQRINPTTKLQTKPLADKDDAESSKELTAGQMLYQASFDLLPATATTKRYLILSSQRTGSNYLCRRLCGVTGRFGMPSEYLHPKAIKMMAPRLVSGMSAGDNIPLAQYIQAIERLRTSADGRFGIKIQPAQLLAAVGQQEQVLLSFVSTFDRIVLMTRRDKLGQAISGAIAQVTGKWFNDGAEPALDDARISTLYPAIAHNLTRYIDEERLILNIGKAVAKPLLRIAYEEIEQDADAALMNLVEFLAAGESLALDEDASMAIPEKPPGDFAQTVRARYLSFISGSD